MEDEDDVWGAGSASKSAANPASHRPTVNAEDDEPREARRPEKRSAPSSVSRPNVVEDEDETPEQTIRRLRVQTDDGFLNPQRWILIGPAASGKTSLVGSFEQAVSAPSKDHLELRLHAANDACQEVLSSALSRLLDEGKAQTSTTASEDLAFTLEVRPNRRSMNVLMADAQGHSMFTGNNRHMAGVDERRTIETLEREWKSADCLLLLIPAERDEADSAVPISQEVSQGLSHLTRKMLVRHIPAPPQTPSWWQRLFGTNAATPENSPRLPFKRILILITKADLVAQSLLDDYHHWQVEQRDPNGYRAECPLPAALQARKNLTARDVAEAMEPVSSARRILTEKVLNQIVKDVRDDCKVAVSFVSVKGFSRAGHPIANKIGQAVPPPGEAMSRQFRDKIVREWNPWGLRAALYFLATGELIHGEPIAALNREVVRESDYR